jgi:hypothetical protein
MIVLHILEIQKRIPRKLFFFVRNRHIKIHKIKLLSYLDMNKTSNDLVMSMKRVSHIHGNVVPYCEEFP